MAALLELEAYTYKAAAELSISISWYLLVSAGMTDSDSLIQITCCITVDPQQIRLAMQGWRSAQRSQRWAVDIGRYI